MAPSAPPASDDQEAGGAARRQHHLGDGAAREFPKRFLLTPRCVVWDLGEVEAWLEMRRKRPIRPAPPPDVRMRISRPVRNRSESKDARSWG